MLTKTQVCRHLLAMQRHAVYLMSYCFLPPCSVLLTLGKHGCPQGKAHICCLGWNPCVWSDGRCRDCKFILSLHVCPPPGHLTPSHFDEHVFCFFSKLSLLCFSRIKCSLKVDYKDYLETWFLYRFPKSERAGWDCFDVFSFVLF